MSPRPRNVELLVVVDTAAKASASSADDLLAAVRRQESDILGEGDIAAG
jgi:hypothetical protein